MMVNMSAMVPPVMGNVLSRFVSQLHLEGIASFRQESFDITSDVGYNCARIEAGEVPEWLNGTVSKTVVVLVATVGSNPTLSADELEYPAAAGFFLPE
jgi:hypothetical protein